MNLAAVAEQVLRGEVVTFTAHGNSMSGRIEDGDLVTVVPLHTLLSLCKGDVVLAKVNGHWYLHLISAVGSDGRYQISNNRGRINGWTRHIVGRVLP